jgi:hypothetical protein
MTLTPHLSSHLAYLNIFLTLLADYLIVSASLTGYFFPTFLLIPFSILSSYKTGGLRY